MRFFFHWGSAPNPASPLPGYTELAALRNSSQFIRKFSHSIKFAPSTRPLMRPSLRACRYFRHVFAENAPILPFQNSFGHVSPENAAVCLFQRSFGHIFPQNVPVLRYERKIQANSSEVMFKVRKVLAKAYKVYGKSCKVLKMKGDLVRYINLCD